MAQVSVTPVSNIPACPQPICDTLWGPRLLVTLGTPTCSGVSHQTGKIERENVSKHIIVTAFSPCVQLRVLYVTYRVWMVCLFQHLLLSLCCAGRTTQTKALCCSQSLYDRGLQSLVSPERRGTIMMGTLCSRVVGLPLQALCQIFNLQLQLLGAGYYLLAVFSIFSCNYNVVSVVNWKSKQ